MVFMPLNWFQKLFYEEVEGTVVSRVHYQKRIPASSDTFTMMTGGVSGIYMTGNPEGHLDITDFGVRDDRSNIRTFFSYGDNQSIIKGDRVRIRANRLFSDKDYRWIGTICVI